jgi:cytochrome c-type biogenesis protein CcmH/NrfG
MTEANTDVFKKALERDPGNSFARYAIAMEYRKHKQYDESLAAFADVIEHDSAYIPAYQMGGQTAVDADQKGLAREMLEKGIKTAREQDNDHAASEMTELLDSI